MVLKLAIEHRLQQVFHKRCKNDTDAERPELAFVMAHFVNEPHWLVSRLPNTSGGGSAAAHLAKCQQQVLAGVLAHWRQRDHAIS